MNFRVQALPVVMVSLVLAACGSGTGVPATDQGPSDPGPADPGYPPDVPVVDDGIDPGPDLPDVIGDTGDPGVDVTDVPSDPGDPD